MDATAPPYVLVKEYIDVLNTINSTPEKASERHPEPKPPPKGPCPPLNNHMHARRKTVTY